LSPSALLKVLTLTMMTISKRFCHQFPSGGMKRWLFTQDERESGHPENMVDDFNFGILCGLRFVDLLLVFSEYKSFLYTIVTTWSTVIGSKGHLY